MISSLTINIALKKCGAEKFFSPVLVGKVVIDSRKAEKGDLFLAFKGEKADGHSFVQKMVENGIYCVGTEDIDNEKYFKIDDVSVFLSVLAVQYRDVIKSKIIALTGSSGKTTTRNFIVQALKPSLKSIHSTSGNLNNDLGLPVTLLSKPLYADFTVLEMGMNHSGEIAELVKIAKPEMVLITNIGFAHIGNFNSRDELADAKLEIFEYSNGTLYGHLNDNYIKKWVRRHPERRFVNMDDKILNLKGDFPEYVIENANAAITVASDNGINPEKSLNNIDMSEKLPLRGETVIIGSRIFVVDCYNANPDSMKKSLTGFISKYNNGIPILGEMGELGSFSPLFHLEIMEMLNSMRILDRTLFFGDGFKKVLENVSFDGITVRVFDDLEELVSSIPTVGEFLLKGSRSNRLERMLDLVKGV